MPHPRLVSTWALVAGLSMFGIGAYAVERADLFPDWRLAVSWSPMALPATRVVSPADIATGRPILALAVGEAALRGPVGILEHKRLHGREWEREGSVAYYDGGRLLFASGVGVRVHGGGSRLNSPRQGFRLYFRREYGPRQFAPGILFGPEAQPIRRLIVHNDVRRDSDRMMWHFANPLSYDIARAMGAIAPETRPVRFYLNEVYQGPFVLTERIDEHYFAAHRGHGDVLQTPEAFDRLWKWVLETRPLSMARVAGQVDLESLTRWFLAVAFCATRDAYQSPGQFLDLTRPAGWFWVNWDMDLSFRRWDLDSYQYLLERIEEPRRGRSHTEPRAQLLTHLLSQDSAYRDYFKRIFLQVMNHRVTRAFLRERYDHYLHEAQRLEVENVRYLPRLREFLERRPDFFRLTTEQWLNAPTSQPVTLVAPPGVPLRIDGETVFSGYRGLYFPDMDIEVEVGGERAAHVRGWRINGRGVAGGTHLVFRADRPTTVEVLFDGLQPRLRSQVDSPQPAAPPAADRGPKPLWRRIPAGSFWMGCVPEDSECEPNELPRTRVVLPEPFDIMAHEVSAGIYSAFARATSRMTPRQPEWYADASHPVVNVTWDEAQSYCQRQGGRLPTEQEWEYAARGGVDGQRYPWGNDPPVIPGGGDPATWRQTAPVGSVEPNRFGLWDTAGNVWEWTMSRYRPTLASAPGDGPYDLRTIKGGSWDSSPRRRRSSERAALARHGRHNLYVGFRCVRPATAQARLAAAPASEPATRRAPGESPNDG
jgi:formylglycine-generating enzyme required for sulfatase activity